MDPTLNIIIDKLTQLTNKINSITQNSKRIHDLDEATTTENVYIAVSDGSNTGKTIYKPSEVSKEEFENITNFVFSIDGDNNLFAKTQDGNVISLINLDVLLEEVIKYTIQDLTPTQQQTARDNIKSLSTTPNGTDLLIGTNNKIADTYLPDSLFGQLKWGGTFNASGIISATADFPQLNGTNITALNTVQYKGVYFIASFDDSAVINIHGVEYNNGDWAVANGNANGFNKADNSDAVSSVAGRRGVVVLDMNDIQGLVAELAGFVKKDGSVSMDAALGFSTYDAVLLETRGLGWQTNTILSKGYDPAYGGDYTAVGVAGSSSNNSKLYLGANGWIYSLLHGTSANWSTAYNERVAQFNTTYTTSVYTFSLLLGNGTTKSTNLQVSNTHFTISGSGVLQLNAAIAQRINDSVTSNTAQTISATKDFTVSPTVPYASDPEHPVPFLQMQEYISNRFDAISSYSRNVVNTNGSTIGVKEWIKTIVFATNATGTILNPEETLKNGACLNICTQAITAGSIDVNLPVRRLDGSNVSVYSFAQSKSYIFYYNESYNRWDETHAINNS